MRPHIVGVFVFFTWAWRCPRAGQSTHDFLLSINNLQRFLIGAMNSDFNMGDVIKKELKNQERSISWLASKVYCDRSHLSRILNNKFIEPNLLLRISIALNKNFCKELSEYFQNCVDSKR